MKLKKVNLNYVINDISIMSPLQFEKLISIFDNVQNRTLIKKIVQNRTLRSFLRMCIKFSDK